MVVPYRLRSGDPAPTQQSSTTCGAACLTVARMLVDPDLATWIQTGVRAGGGAAAMPEASTQARRFAAYERVVANRTNALVGPAGRLQLPWPRALGTPPWGAAGEIASGASAPPGDYHTSWLRIGGPGRLGAAFDALVDRARPGRPALLYIGSAWLPRHVVLVLPSEGAASVDAYDPAAGRVVDLPRARFVARRLGLAGWDVPWAAIWSRGRPA